MKTELTKLNKRLNRYLIFLNDAEEIFDSICDRQKFIEICLFKIEETTRQMNNLVNQEMINVMHETK